MIMCYRCLSDIYNDFWLRLVDFRRCETCDDETMHVSVHEMHNN